MAQTISSLCGNVMTQPKNNMSPKSIRDNQLSHIIAFAVKDDNVKYQYITMGGIRIGIRLTFQDRYPHWSTEDYPFLGLECGTTVKLDLYNKDRLYRRFQNIIRQLPTVPENLQRLF
jgi:hypothetical protein